MQLMLLPRETGVLMNAPLPLPLEISEEIPEYLKEFKVQ